MGFLVKNQRNPMEKKGALKESNKWVWKKNGEMVEEEGGGPSILQNPNSTGKREKECFTDSPNCRVLIH